MFDLSTIKQVSDAEVVITHPVTGKETDIVFIVCGTDSKEYRQAIRDVMAKRLSSDKESTQDDLENDEAEILSRCTKGFKGLLIDGVEPKFSTEKAKDIYLKWPWLKDQVDKFIANKSNFFLTE